MGIEPVIDGIASDPTMGHRAMGAGLITGVAGYLTSIHVHEAVNSSDATLSAIIGISLPLALSLTLFAIAAFLVVRGLAGSPLRIGAWCLLGFLATGGTGILITMLQLVEGAHIPHPSVLIGNIGTYGAIGGIVVGVYDARQLAVSERLEDEREHAQNLNSRLSVLVRVLRHDIRTNVTVIKGNADQILRGEGDPSHAASIIKEQADDLYAISEKARWIESYLNGSSEDRISVPVVDLVSDVVQDLTDANPTADIHFDLPEDDAALADPMIDVALEHLIQNGLEHNKGQKWVRIETRTTHRAILIRVIDNGPGIPDGEIDVLEQGKETGMEHTSGLGLWVAKWIIEASGGELTFSHRDPTGTIATIHLPRSRTDASPTE